MWPHSVSVKLDPPSDLQSNVSSDYCVLTWSVSPALEPLTFMLSYELAFKRQGEAWEVMLGRRPHGPLSPGSRSRATPQHTKGDVNLES